MTKKELTALASKLTKKMHTAAADLNFELAAQLRDEMLEVKNTCMIMTRPMIMTRRMVMAGYMNSSGRPMLLAGCRG